MIVTRRIQIFIKNKNSLKNYCVVLMWSSSKIQSNMSLNDPNKMLCFIIINSWSFNCIVKNQHGC